MHCLAILHGLKGETSLKPWIEEGVSEVEELARRDYQPKRGAGWHREWQRQLAEAESILEKLIGPDWRDEFKARISNADASDKGDYRKR
tara:strand:- start:1708 stop:1974 length:267 start_codon:yes stop_codon:yes gene_type:complete